MTLEQIDLFNLIRAHYHDDFALLGGSQDAVDAFDDGQFVSPLGVEGLHQIGNLASNLRLYHALGARYVSLTHNCHNAFADAALLEGPNRVAKPKWGGVSKQGRAMIKEMNRIGMIVDLAHTRYVGHLFFFAFLWIIPPKLLTTQSSHDTQRDVLGGNAEWAGSEAPVMFSHSSVYALCPHPRNVKDEILDLAKARNAVVMINFSSDFISCVASDDVSGLPVSDPEHATVAHVVDHVVYIGERIGYDHVGIGSDFDGVMNLPTGLDDVSKFPALVAEMLRREVSNKDVVKVIGGNILRVWKQVEDVANKMQREGVPQLEDNLSDIHFDE